MKGAFFCEACGAEVPSDGTVCPSCGRSFVAVKCPRCGRQGPGEDFDEGCPDCGYLNADSQESDSPKRESRERRAWPISRYWGLLFLLLILLGVLVVLTQCPKAYGHLPSSTAIQN